ncbi:MAG: HI0074 family nucleotidyltransferase substrate-binding subunit [Myxococcota bacterium]
MDRLSERIALAERALAAFQELSGRPNPTAIERDAAIQRFEFTFEAMWKCAQRFLQDVEKIAAGSPRSVIRSSRDVALLDDAQAVLALQMCDDRNQTVHTYNETLAKEIFSRLDGYASLIASWLAKISERAALP